MPDEQNFVKRRKDKDNQKAREIADEGKICSWIFLTISMVILRPFVLVSVVRDPSEKEHEKH